MILVSNNLLDDYQKIDQHFVLNIGNFDGIHSGHQKIINQTSLVARKNDYIKAIITFCNKPAVLFKQNFINTQIFPLEQKIEYFKKLGYKYIFIFEFNSDLKNLSAVEFLNFLSSNKNIKEIIIGENFTFAKNKEGNVDILKKYLLNKNINVSVVPLLYENGQLISSTMIRQHILSGDFSINQYLIEPFYISGLVESGKHQGRLIQFPTANIYIYDQIRPKPSVYATITRYKDYEDFQYNFSMTYVGNKGEIETHVFDKKIDLYNKEIQVYFIKNIRENIKIESLSHLKIVLQTDKENIRRFFFDYFGKNIEAKEFLEKINRSYLDVRK